MGKIKVFDISLTVMAFAALIFLLPPDKEATTTSINNTLNTPSASHDGAKMAHQSPDSTVVSRTM